MTREQKTKICEHFDWLHTTASNVPDDLKDVLKAAYLAGAAYALDIYCPHWISVDEELPKERQSCIILIDRKALQGTPRIRSAVYAPNVMVQQEGFAYNRISKKHHITHWMPLPQPPKGDAK